MAKYDIITVGSATVDVFAHTDPAQSEILKVHHHTDIAYPLGAKILIKELNIFTGGGGTNTAVAFSRLGLKTAYLGMIGNDSNGEMISKNLTEEKVEFIGHKGKTSGYSVILDSVNDDRTIFAYKGCNNDLKLKDSEMKNLDSHWFYFSSMLNDGFKTLEKLAKYAKKRHIKIAFNPSLYLVKKGSSHLKNILSNTEVIIFNKEEAQALHKTESENIFELISETMKLGPKIVVISDGKNGCSCYNSYDKIFYALKPAKVRIVETTGAGDAFASGFIAGLITGKTTELSLKVGMLNAESVIRALGAKNILLGHHAFNTAEHDNRQVMRKPW